jgi:hypothetical protein
LGRSGRRALAAALDSFWATYCDKHGNWLGGSSSGGGSSCCCRYAGQLSRQELSSGADACGAWCGACCGSLLEHLVSSLQQLLSIPGAANLLLLEPLLEPLASGHTQHGEQLQRQGSNSGSLQPATAPDVTAAAAAALKQALPALPGSMQQQLQDLLALGSAAGMQQPQPAGAPHDSFSSTSMPGSSVSPHVSAAAGPAYLLSWGAWCIVLLLALSQVRAW